MNADDFEEQLRSRRIRPVPSEWRDEILGAAALSQIAHPASRVPWWRELLWPCPQAWAGLAAGWIIILVLNAASSDGGSMRARRPEPPAPETLVALREQRRLLAELIAPAAGHPGPRKENFPRPRSEGCPHTRPV